MRWRLQLWSSIVLCSILIAHLVLGWPTRAFFVAAAILVVVLGLAAYRLVNYFHIRQPRPPQPVFLSYDEARKRALAELANSDHFISGSQQSDTDLSGLPQSLRELFAAHSSISIRHGDLALGLRFMKEPPAFSGTIKVGEDTDATHVLVKNEQDDIFITDGSEESLPQTERYPSVYHLIMARVEAIYGPNP